MSAILKGVPNYRLPQDHHEDLHRGRVGRMRYPVVDDMEQATRVARTTCDLSKDEVVTACWGRG